MATQREVADNIDLSDRQVRTLLKQGILPAGKGTGGLDLDSCRVAYIRYLRGLATGQVKDGPRVDLAEEKQRLEVAKLQYQVDELERAARKDDRQWVHHDDHCAAMSAIIGSLKEDLQHYSTISAGEIVAMCGGSITVTPMVGDRIFDLVVTPAFNDLAGKRIENAFFCACEEEDDGEE